MASWDRALPWPPGLYKFVCGPCTDAGRPAFMVSFPWEVHGGCVNAGGKNGLPVCKACKTSIRSDAQHVWCAPTCRGTQLNALYGPMPGAYQPLRNKNPCADWAAYQAALAAPAPRPAIALPPAQAAPPRRIPDPDEEAENSAIIRERAQEGLAVMVARGHSAPTILVLDTRQANDEVLTCGVCGHKGKIHMKRGATEKYSGAVMAFDCKKLAAPKAKP